MIMHAAERVTLTKAEPGPLTCIRVSLTKAEASAFYRHGSISQRQRPRPFRTHPLETLGVVGVSICNFMNVSIRVFRGLSYNPPNSYYSP
eukprot:SAG22_NODE_7589_length_726_cov_0.990431_2_plen_90_part_00